jgi:hypothetical protein
MAIGAYTNPTWANGGTPAINAANLQATTDQIKNITDAAVSGGASPTKIWTSTNDGNGGQPPAPKPNAVSAATPGYVQEISTTTNGQYYGNGTTTAGGASASWMVAVDLFDATGHWVGAFHRIYTGAEGLYNNTTNQRLSGYAMRINNL